MNRKLSVQLAAAVGCLSLAIATACQTYDFEPVEPLAIAQNTQSKVVVAKKSRPNLMLLVDKSGSMRLPVNTADPACPAGCGVSSDCPGGCKTRMSELKSAMNTFLTANGTKARFGLTNYPIDAVCGAPASVTIDLSSSNDVDSELQAKAGEINTAIQALVPSGGTPTGVSLKMLSGYAALADPGRDNFIVVLTDGLPNCNDANPGNCTQPATCRCTLANAACGASLADQFCVKGCLDKNGTAEEVAQLARKSIRTIVVGFGADVDTGDGFEVLNAMAEVGGFPRACPNGTNAECDPAGTCNQATKLCNRKYYQASTGDQLAKALDEISRLVNENPCSWTLVSPPDDPRFLAVLIDGQATQAGPDTWNYNAGKVTFTGALCTRVSNATPSSPVKVEFRTVEAL